MVEAVTKKQQAMGRNHGRCAKDYDIFTRRAHAYESRVVINRSAAADAETKLKQPTASNVKDK